MMNKTQFIHHNAIIIIIIYNIYHFHLYKTFVLQEVECPSSINIIVVLKGHKQLKIAGCPFNIIAYHCVKNL